jgi:protein involved in polysaccharide export with SLBB domain
MKFKLLAFAFFLSLTASLFADVPMRKGDIIEIRLAGVDPTYAVEFQGVYTIDDDGNVNLPHLGLVQAAGQLTNKLQASIEQKLRDGKIYTHPTITVNVQPNQRFVNVSGYVRSPGRIPYQNDMTILGAINTAGGRNEYAGDKIILTRDGKQDKLSFKALSKDPSKDIKVMPGDSIEVKQSLF